MISVLLVDADVENIKNFRAYIKNTFGELQVVGQVSFAADYMQAITERKPDLVLADIRLFGTSLMRLMHEVHEFFPRIRFILYGTYNDSAYMEKVLEFGVIETMYLPVKPSELDRVLKQAILVFAELEKAEQQKLQLAIDYKAHMALFYDRFLLNLLQGYVTDPFEIQNSLRYFNIPLEPSFVVFTIRIDHFKKVILTMDEAEKHLLVYQIYCLTKSKLDEKKNGVAFINRMNSVSVILGGSVPLAQVLSFCDQLRIEISLTIKQSVTIGVGRAYNDVTDICISYRETEAALRYRYWLGYHSVIFIDYVEPQNHITYRYPHEKQELLVYAAVAGEYAYCEVLLKQIFLMLKTIDTMPERLFAKIIMNILISISRYASEQGINIEKQFQDFFPSKQIFALQTLDEAHQFLQNALQLFCAYMVDLRNQNKQKMVQKVIDYIDSHYYENISLSKMAVYAETTTEYLKKIFMETQKKSIYDYIIGVRMFQAKKLMKDRAQTDELIAVQVGYDDVKHFRSVFKQHVGLFTHEFRNQ